MVASLRFGCSCFAVVAIGCRAGADTPPVHGSRGTGASFIAINASSRHQKITGFGVNGQPRNWGSGVAVKPVLSRLVKEMNATLWRVEINNGLSDWEATNDDASPSTFNWSYYDGIFGKSKAFQDLWSYLRYLNELGVTNIELASHGTAPKWMGGIRVPRSQFDEYVETQLAVLEYALTRIPDPKPVFRYFSPFNEPEIQEPPEGIALGSAESATIVSKLVTRLNAERAAHPELAKIKLVAPEAAYEKDTAPSAAFRTSLTTSPLVQPWLAAIAHHTYDPRATQDWNRLSVPEWMTETNGFRPAAESANCGDTVWAHALDLANGTIAALNAGVGAVMVWTEYDAPHSHDDDLWETFGLIETKIAGFGRPCGVHRRVPTQAELDSATYVPKPTYHAFRQMTAFAKPEAVRIQASSSDDDIRVAALQNADGGLVVVGVNNGEAKTIAVQLSGVTTPPVSLAVYTTTESAPFVKGPAIAVIPGQAATASIPGKSVFAVVSAGAGAP